MQRSGLPRNMAFQVAMGNMTLNEALEKLAFHDQVEKLIRRHAFPRSLATQIAMKQVELDVVLRKQRQETYMEENRLRSLLTESMEQKLPITVLLHGQQRRTGQVLSVSAYEFELQDGKTGAVETIHKLQAQAGWEAKKNAQVLSALKRDKAHAQLTGPIEKPQDRFHCSNRRLFQYMEDSTRLTVRLLEGDLVQGTVDWLGRWELGIKTKKGAVVTVFRHAMADLEEG